MKSDKKDDINRISFVFYLRKKMMMACPKPSKDDILLD